MLVRLDQVGRFIVNAELVSGCGGVTGSSRNFDKSLREAMADSVYRTLNYERNHSEEKGSQPDAVQPIR